MARQSTIFDPYYVWLGIGPEHRPPNYYRLLNVPECEPSAEVIENGYNRQMGFLRAIKDGEHVDAAEKLKSELARARLHLLDPTKKREYDVRLKSERAAEREAKFEAEIQQRLDEHVAAERANLAAALATLDAELMKSERDRKELAVALASEQSSLDIGPGVLEAKLAPRRKLLAAEAEKWQAVRLRILWLVPTGAAFVAVLFCLLGLLISRLGSGVKHGTAHVEVGEPPQDAQYKLDGKPMEPEALEKPLRLPVGRHHLLALGLKKEPFSTTFDVQAGEKASVAVRWDPQPEFGELIVTLTDRPVTLELQVDGRPLSSAELQNPVRLATGEHSLLAEGPSTEPFFEAFTIRADEQTRLQLVWIKPPDSPRLVGMLSQPPTSRPIVAARQLGPELVNSLGMRFKLIPAGSFEPPELQTRRQSKPNRVRIDQPYYLTIHELTQAHYERVMKANPSPRKGATLPVTNVTRDDAIDFCNRLSELSDESKVKRVYRLPTDAEWEYAARADSMATWCCGDDASQLRNYAWCDERPGASAHPVGLKKPNAWGFFDMHGNVWEWCNGTVATAKGPLPMYRGGACDMPAASCRSSQSEGGVPSHRAANLGFRVAMQIGATTPLGMPTSPITANTPQLVLPAETPPKSVTPEYVSLPPIELIYLNADHTPSRATVSEIWLHTVGVRALPDFPLDMLVGCRPDSMLIVSRNRLCVQSFKTIQPRVLREFQPTVHDLALHPMEDRIAVCRRTTPNGQPEIVIHRLNGTDAQSLGFGYDPVWSADGRTLIYTGADPDGGWFIGLREGSTTRKIKIATHPAISVYPTPSPDGKQIAFSTRARDGTMQLGLASWDGKQVQQLTKTGDMNTRAVFSPDGTRIAFQRGLNSPTKLLVLVLATGKETIVAHDVPSCRAVWQTNQQRIPFATASQPSRPADGERSRAGEERDDNGLTLKLTWCPAGSFQMGAAPGDSEAFRDEQPAVKVTLSRGFWLGKTEITQRQWKQVMGTEPWQGQPNVQVGSDLAVSWVSWDDATEFCRRLTAQEIVAGQLPRGWSYTLPTAAQWEYACRAGTTTRFSFGDDALQLGEYAWYEANASAVGDSYAHGVGLKLANAWGLHDMHGNVAEWCRDGYDFQLVGGADPVSALGPPTFRGGSWRAAPRQCRVSRRGGYSPASRRHDIGFRIALTPSD